jgi:predicted metal-binding membrane protein
VRFDRRSIRDLRVALAWRPEWPVAGFVAVAWAGLIGLRVQETGSAPVPTHFSPVEPSVTGAAAFDWALMCVAMMVPTTLPAVRHVGLNSIRARRWRAVTIYTLCYLAMWCLVGVMMLRALGAAEAAGLSERELLAGGLAMGTLWQLGKPKRLALLACRRPLPLPPVGSRADRACAAFGMYQAGWCVVSCWPLMLLMVMSGHVPLPIMGAVTLVALAERRASDPPRFRRSLAAALATATLVVPLLA